MQYKTNLFFLQLYVKIRYISYINQLDNSDNSAEMDANSMLALAQFYLDNNRPVKSDYSKKYEDALKNAEQEQLSKEHSSAAPQPVLSSSEQFVQKDDKETLIKALKTFRLQQSRKENIKPYCIFNDNQMNDLIQKSPTDKNALLNVSGFGPVKTEKYGDAILEILKKHQ